MPCAGMLAPSSAKDDDGMMAFDGLGADPLSRDDLDQDPDRLHCAEEGLVEDQSTQIARLFLTCRLDRQQLSKL